MTNQQQNATHAHKWGYKDTHMVLQPDRSVKMTGDRYELSGLEMPEFVPFLEEMLEISIDPADIKEERAEKPVAEPVVNEAFCRALQQTFAATQYTLDPQARLIHSHGQATADEIYPVLYTKIERIAGLIFLC